MERKFIVNGKVTYPLASGSKTTFTFRDTETNAMINLSTTDATETAAFDYGDTVVFTITKEATTTTSNTATATSST